MVRDSREEWKTYNSVFDQFTNRLLFKLEGQAHFDELKSIIGPGKEAVVFTATKGKGAIAVKIYRLETANFRKMYGYIRVDPRYPDIKNQQRQIIFSWTEREFRNLIIAREAGVRVPTPIAHKYNVLLMEFIGHGTDASPILKHSPPDDVPVFAKECFRQLELLTKAGLVHGDLSEYNILNLDEEPVFIDFSHSVPLKAPNSKELLERDVENLCAYFAKHGVKTDTEKMMAKLVAVYEKALEKGLSR